MKRRRSSTIATGIMAISSLAFFGNVDSDKLPHSEKFADDMNSDEENLEALPTIIDTEMGPYQPKYKKSISDDRSLPRFTGRRSNGRAMR